MDHAMVMVPADQVPAVLPVVIDLLRRAEERSRGALLAREIVEECITGRQQMWIVWRDEDRIAKAVLLTAVISERSGDRYVEVKGLIGSDMSDWLPLVVDTLKEFARQQGCRRIVETGRRGLVEPLRALGWRPVQVVMEMRLSDEP